MPPRDKIKFLEIQVDSDDQGVSIKIKIKNKKPDRAVKTVLVFYRPGMILQGKAFEVLSSSGECMNRPLDARTVLVSKSVLKKGYVERDNPPC